MTRTSALFAAIALATTGLTGTVALADGHREQAKPRPTIDSSIKDLLANPQTKAVLEKHLPGVSQHPALPQFQDMTLRAVMPMSEGAVTPEIIAAIDRDLKALPAA